MDFHLVPKRPQSNPGGTEGRNKEGQGRAGLTPVDSKEKETRQTWKPMPIMIISSFELLLKNISYMHIYGYLFQNNNMYTSIRARRP